MSNNSGAPLRQGDGSVERVSLSRPKPLGVLPLALTDSSTSTQVGRNLTGKLHLGQASSTYLLGSQGSVNISNGHSDATAGLNGNDVALSPSATMSEKNGLLLARLATDGTIARRDAANDPLVNPHSNQINHAGLSAYGRHQLGVISLRSGTGEPRGSSKSMDNSSGAPTTEVLQHQQPEGHSIDATLPLSQTIPLTQSLVNSNNLNDSAFEALQPLPSATEQAGIDTSMQLQTSSSFVTRPPSEEVPVSSATASSAAPATTSQLSGPSSTSQGSAGTNQTASSATSGSTPPGSNAPSVRKPNGTNPTNNAANPTSPSRSGVWLQAPSTMPASGTIQVTGASFVRAVPAPSAEAASVVAASLLSKNVAQKPSGAAVPASVLSTAVNAALGKVQQANNFTIRAEASPASPSSPCGSVAATPRLTPLEPSRGPDLSPLAIRGLPRSSLTRSDSTNSLSGTAIPRFGSNASAALAVQYGSLAPQNASKGTGQSASQQHLSTLVSISRSNSATGKLSQQPQQLAQQPSQQSAQVFQMQVSSQPSFRNTQLARGPDVGLLGSSLSQSSQFSIDGLPLSQPSLSQQTSLGSVGLRFSQQTVTGSQTGSNLIMLPHQDSLMSSTEFKNARSRWQTRSGMLTATNSFTSAFGFMPTQSQSPPQSQSPNLSQTPTPLPAGSTAASSSLAVRGNRNALLAHSPLHSAQAGDPSTQFVARTSSFIRGFQTGLQNTFGRIRGPNPPRTDLVAAPGKNGVLMGYVGYQYNDVSLDRSQSMVLASDVDGDDTSEYDQEDENSVLDHRSRELNQVAHPGPSSQHSTKSNKRSKPRSRDLDMALAASPAQEDGTTGDESITTAQLIQYPGALTPATRPFESYSETNMGLKIIPDDPEWNSYMTGNKRVKITVAYLKDSESAQPSERDVTVKTGPFPAMPAPACLEYVFPPISLEAIIASQERV